MKLSFEITSETARSIIKDLQEQLAQQEAILAEGEDPNTILSMRPTLLPLEHSQKGLVTRAYGILRDAENGTAQYSSSPGRLKRVGSLEAFCRLDKFEYRTLAGLNGKATKVIQAALARKGLQLWMSADEIEAYREGSFKLSEKYRRMI
jgi:hypothetical protein